MELYGSRTLASIKPEISQGLTSLLDEIRTTNDPKIMHTAVSGYRKPIGNRSQYKVSTRPNRPPDPRMAISLANAVSFRNKIVGTSLRPDKSLTSSTTLLILTPDPMQTSQTVTVH